MSHVALLNGQVVAVTGASRGTGAAIATQAASAEAKVLAVRRSGTALEPARIGADATAEETPDAIACRELPAFGGLDGLVNCHDQVPRPDQSYVTGSVVLVDGGWHVD